MLKKIIYFIVTFLFLAQARDAGAVGNNSSEPVEITADSLEVLQAENKAIFTGDVLAKQGDMNIRSDKMTVHYKPAKQAPGAEGLKNQASASAASKISKVEVDDNVFIATPHETAKGDHGVYDVDAGVVTLLGDVTLTSMKNIVKGHKLVYNLKTGQSKMISADGAASGGKKQRVRGVFVPNGK